MFDPHRRRAHAAAAGFTLVEVIVALALLTTGALTMAALAVQTTAIVARARQHGAAAALADGAIAEVQNRDGTSAPLDCLFRDIDACVTFVDGTGVVTRDVRAAYSVRWAVVPFTTAPASSVIVACGVPAAERRPGTGLPRSCVARLAMAGVP